MNGLGTHCLKHVGLCCVCVCECVAVVAVVWVGTGEGLLSKCEHMKWVMVPAMFDIVCGAVGW